VAGRFVDEGLAAGHRIRDRSSISAPARVVHTPVIIVGAGIAGLSAAWWLDRRGFRDFLLLELERQPGGNARWSENEVTAFPWGAHYVPVPGRRARYVRALFEDLGVLRDGRWEERHLCHSPQERLFLHGRWQEGLEPEVGLTAGDREQFRRFHSLMAEFRSTGAFAVPMEAGDAGRFASLDRLSMAAWMAARKFDSPYLDWYAGYACRDDYGCLPPEVSAWAGIHYFAAREPQEKGPLTWPEGNGWIVRRLLEKLGGRLRVGDPVRRILRRGSRLAVRTETTEYVCDAAIFAAPTFLAPYVLEDAPAVSGFHYSPWLVANLTLDRLPRERGLAPCWDNVLYDSPALGYVVATHQSLRTHVDRTVWTYYWALAGDPPARGRALLLEKDWTWWKEAILADLERAHPDIRQAVARIDILRLGHAMIRPGPGFLFSQSRRRLAQAQGPVLFANSDLSGLPLFEEANYRGVRAADLALARLGGTPAIR